MSDTVTFPGVGGWLPDVFDGRDHPFTSKLEVKDGSSINLRDKYKKFWYKDVYDQKTLSSCVANATASAYYFELQKQLDFGHLDRGTFPPSRLFIYWIARTGKQDKEGKRPIVDKGCNTRTAMKGLEQFGVCSETTWPYLEQKVDIYPGLHAFLEAKSNHIVKYERLDIKRTRDAKEQMDTPAKEEDGQHVLNNLRQCLSEGHPVVIGFWYYWKQPEWLPSGPEGLLVLPPLPGPRHSKPPQSDKGRYIYGGHAVLAVGYDDENRLVRCLNSWGDDFSKHGLFWMPYYWITDFEATDDFWMLRLVQALE
ncbi:hypothetical protein MMC28_001457 [Mycoblastus sanguinarius]|nr:hypothetical protein [Mycoblastus sanguinarius]